MIPPFAPLFKHMDGIAFQAMRPRPAGSIIQNSTVSTQVSKFVNVEEVFSRYSKSLMVSHYEPAIKHSHPNGGRADTVTRDFSI